MTGAGKDHRVILASTSPRRRELLRWLGIAFEVLGSQVEEEEPAGADPRGIAADLALQKAHAVARMRPGYDVIGADTVVSVDGVSLGKPADEAGAFQMLERLAGRDHEVITAVAVVRGAELRHGVVVSRVTMRASSPAEIKAYVATKEPFDKAGGYALQGQGGALVESVHGCTLTVVGFPLCLVRSLLDGRDDPTIEDFRVCDRAAQENYPRAIRGFH